MHTLQKDPRALLSGREIGFSWLMHGMRRHSTITFPDLLESSVRIWGDWGPMTEIGLGAR
jgi:hypothetical protein